MKVLNLDTFGNSAGRSITIFGKEYEVIEMSVDNFIETTKDAERLGDNPSEPEKIEATVKMIQRCIPDIEPAILRRLEMYKLAVIVRFLRGELDEQLAAAAKDAEAKGDEAAKK